jgi:hypothetical protein
MDFRNESNLLIAVGVVLTLCSCSGKQLLKNAELPVILGRNITQSSWFMDDSTGSVCIARTLNGKRVAARSVDAFKSTPIPSSSSSLVLSGEEILWAESPTIMCRTLTNAALAYSNQMVPNADTSAILLTVAARKVFEGKRRQLLLLTSGSNQSREVAFFSPRHAYILSPVPFKPNTEFRDYDLASEARWIDDTTFALASTDGVTLYNTRDPNYQRVIFDQPAYSNFVVSGRKLIVQNKVGIFTIGVDNNRIDTLLIESGTTHLRVQGEEIFYVLGWRLYRISQRHGPPVLVLKASNLIRDFWIANDGHAVLRVGPFASNAEVMEYINVDLRSGTSVRIDNSRADILDANLSDDGGYFVIHKKTVHQFKKYNVLLVCDIARNARYEFDLDDE